MTSKATIAGETRAWAGGALTLAAKGLEVTATDNTSAAPVTIVNGGGAFAISITEALIEISRKTEAQVVSGANIDIGGGHLTLLADATTSGVGSAETASVSAIDIGLTTIETVLDNTTRAAIEPLATVRANGGNVSVSALADNRGDASIKSLGVGLLLRVGISEPSADVSATTEALAQGSIIGSAPGQSAGNVTVLAQANDRSTAGSAAQGGGLISVSTSSVNATTTSTVQAGGGGVIDSGGSVSIQAFSRSDADASSKSSSGGAVDVSNLEANASASPTVNAFVDPGARITARQGLTVAATHGEDPPVYSDGSFNAVSGVDPAANTIGFGAAHGLLTGDTVSYNRNGAATAVGGLVDGRNYGVIVANDTTLRLGATFGSFGSDGTTPRIDLARDTITFAGAHNLQDGDRVVYSADAGSATIGGLSSGSTYVVKRVDANTIKLADVDALSGGQALQRCGDQRQHGGAHGARLRQQPGGDLSRTVGHVLRVRPAWTTPPTASTSASATAWSAATKSSTRRTAPRSAG
jgi:large repetitive protein